MTGTRGSRGHSAASRRTRGRWDAEHPRWPNTNTVTEHFGSWSKGLATAGLPATVREFELPLTERIFTARRLAAGGLAITAIAAELGVSRRTAANYLRAGDCPACVSPLASPASDRPCAASLQRPSQWTAEAIVEAMRWWERETGLQPTVGMWGLRRAPLSKWHDEQPRWPSGGQVINVFGSWGEAQRQAGFAPLKRTWTREQAIAALHDAARTEGTVPRRSGWEHATADRPAATTVRDLFGTWQAALRAAGLG
jgi:hypothetical protein